MAKTLIGVGILLILAGVLMYLGERFFGSWRMPGDIVIKRGNFSFYFPIGTSILISLILSLLLYLWNQK